jgi:hypothetical protein
MSREPRRKGSDPVAKTGSFRERSMATVDVIVPKAITDHEEPHVPSAEHLFKETVAGCEQRRASNGDQLAATNYHAR